MTALYVLTCPRPTETPEENPWPYVVNTLQAINSESVPASARVLFVDESNPTWREQGQGSLPTMPGAMELLNQWDTVTWARPPMSVRGNKLPYFALLSHAYKAGYDDVLVLEDDLIFSDNAVRRMLTFPVPDDLAFVQFFSPHILPVAHMQPGLWRPPQHSSQFCQALKFPRRTLMKLDEWQSQREFHKFVESDMALNLFMERKQLRYGVHCPDLVQHVGESSATVPGSSVRETSGRISQCFGDETFDALRLYDLDGRFR